MVGAKAGELPGIPVVESFGINDKPLRGTIRQTYDYAKAQLDKALALNPTDSKYLFTEWVNKGLQGEAGVLVPELGQRRLCEDIIASRRRLPHPDFRICRDDQRAI